jgi:hypothetical protein
VHANKIHMWFSLALVFLIALIFAMVGCSTVPANTSPQSSGVNVSISLVNPSVKSGDAFTADVLMDSNVILRGAQCALSFDPALMKCDRVVEGNFFKDWAADNGSSTIVFPEPAINNTTGNVTDIGIVVMGPSAGGVKGSGVFCTYYFTDLTNGVAKPILLNVLLADENGRVFPPTDSGK